MMRKYILENKLSILCCDVIKWAEWFERADRHVAKTDIGIPAWKYWLGKLLKIKNWEPVQISTVFLGLDHSFGGDIPILFETMVFGGNYDMDQERYATWDDAEKGHKQMCEKVGL